jgi:tetratricopeptide (TPR) repeat protein
MVKAKSGALDPSAFDIAEKGKIEQYGSGWGALEDLTRDIPVSRICDFPKESMDAEQAQWLTLLESGSLIPHAPTDKIESYCVDAFWLGILSEKTDPDWYECNQLGVMSYANGEYERAKQYFIRSLELCQSPWSYRDLAQIEKNIEGNKLDAATHMLAAIALKKDYLPLAVETAYALMAAEKYSEFISLWETLPENVRESGRIKMLLGACYSKLGQAERAAEIITSSLRVDDIKEGEYSLSAIWTEIYGQILARRLGVSADELSAEQILKEYPLPYELDYRMH